MYGKLPRFVCPEKSVTGRELAAFGHGRHRTMLNHAMPNAKGV
jgi:hypothetical protein